MGSIPQEQSCTPCQEKEEDDQDDGILLVEEILAEARAPASDLASSQRTIDSPQSAWNV